MQRARSSAGGILLAILVAGWLAGCASSGGYDVYRDENVDFGLIRTVAILPLQNLTKEENAGERVRDVFFTMLMASSGIYVVPAGEVARAVSMTGIAAPATPTSAEAAKLATALKADSVIVGSVKEYGEVRAVGATSSMISLSFKMMEGGSGKIIWVGSSTRGGVSMKDRLLGGGGQPMNVLTEQAIHEILNQLFD